MFGEMGPNFLGPRKCFARYFGNPLAVNIAGSKESTFYKVFYGKPDFGVDRKYSGRNGRAANVWRPPCKSMYGEMGPNFPAPRKFLASFLGNLFAVQNLGKRDFFDVKNPGKKKSTVCKAPYSKPDFAVDRKYNGPKTGPQTRGLAFAN